MASVPVSLNQLETAAEIIATNLLEDWALNDRFTIDELEAAKKNALDDTIFVINEFMSVVNEIMRAEAPSKLI